MAKNKLVKLRPVSGSTSTPDAGAGVAQQISITVNGMTDGAGIAVDRSENIYISDFANHVIYRWKKGASSTQIFAGAYGVSGNADGAYSVARFNKPAGIFCDRAGRIWVVDSGNALIRRIDENANVYTVASIPASMNGDQIGDIVVDDSENIFFIDSSQ